MAKPEQVRRCAIYTRVSTDAGLDQDFNSLDAQREAAEAYIKSQAHEGWTLVDTTYADGGFSGGSLVRPALQKLLDDIRAGRIDTILVYKVDRLTRSLADFAKLVELFDAHGVSFVSITQAFNTTSSMGRLTLNVLLSFAQFEREVTAERIRDKITASKKNGIWMGGPVSLGYRVENRRLHIVEEEAATVRMIFQQYLKLRSLVSLVEKLRKDGIRTRLRKHGAKKVGGIAFTLGPLTYLLKNRIYLGEIVHKEKCYPGEHAPLLDKALFDAVQSMLMTNCVARKRSAGTSPAILTGKLFDDAGNLMTPRHAQKGAKRYYYYTSRAFIEGRKEEAGSIARVAANDVEPHVIHALRHIILPQPAGPLDDKSIIEEMLERVTVTQGALLVRGKETSGQGSTELTIPWRRRPSKVSREILLAAPDRDDLRPIKSRERKALVRAIAHGRMWLKELSTGKAASVDVIATREQRSTRSVNMALGLAFLAPDIVAAAIDGTLPRGIGLTDLYDLPPLWAAQRERLAINPQRRQDVA